jgi:hypothetical protein
VNCTLFPIVVKMMMTMMTMMMSGPMIANGLKTMLKQKRYVYVAIY